MLSWVNIHKKLWKGNEDYSNEDNEDYSRIKEAII